MFSRSGVALVLSISYEGRHVAGWAWAWPSHLLNVLRGYSCNMRLYMSLCARLVQEVSATWETARHLDDYTVMPCKEVRTSIGICLVQSGDPEPLCKAALRRSSLLSFNDLFEALRCFDLLAVVDASSGRCRTLFLRVLCEYVAPGDLNFQTMVLGSEDEAESLRFLAQDPVFEMAWEEMDDDDKHELPEVKKAINRNKARVTSAYQRMPKPKAKRKSFARAKGKVASKPLAKPKAAPLPDVPPVPADPPSPAVLLAPAALHPLHGMPGSYQYVPFGSGHLVFSVASRKINAHCAFADHQQAKGRHFISRHCHMDRSCPEAPDFGVQRVKGRPIGLLALWLKKAADSNCKDDHHACKPVYASRAFYEERKVARSEVWALSATHPDVHTLFSIEAQVPNDILGDDVPPELFEPMWPF